MTVAAPEEFDYRDKKLGDTTAVTVTTDARVFHPTSTSVLLLRIARQAIQQPCRSLLDLGCGCGIVAVVLAQHVAPGTSVSAFTTRKKLTQNVIQSACRKISTARLVFMPDKSSSPATRLPGSSHLPARITKS